MAYLPSLPAGAVLDVIRACPQPALPPLDHHQALLRRRLPLAAAERELIATHVPGLNARGCGSGVLQAIAQTFGIDQVTLGALLADVTTAAAGERTKLSPFRDAVSTRWSFSPFGAPAGDGSEPKPRRGRNSNRCLSGRDKRHLSQRTSA
jgi:hypothetical protein